VEQFGNVLDLCREVAVLNTDQVTGPLEQGHNDFSRYLKKVTDIAPVLYLIRRIIHNFWERACPLYSSCSSAVQR
jgi:hypothetical protein